LPSEDFIRIFINDDANIIKQLIDQKFGLEYIFKLYYYDSKLSTDTIKYLIQTCDNDEIYALGMSQIVYIGFYYSMDNDDKKYMSYLNKLTELISYGLTKERILYIVSNYLKFDNDIFELVRYIKCSIRNNIFSKKKIRPVKMLKERINRNIPTDFIESAKTIVDVAVTKKLLLSQNRVDYALNDPHFYRNLCYIHHEFMMAFIKWLEIRFDINNPYILKILDAIHKNGSISLYSYCYKRCYKDIIQEYILPDLSDIAISYLLE